ncbi:3,4-dihydroxy-2-butanone-4-phosphate synthase [Estrella lausannensis]|uniref:3,4-dihydroxy-2-butanone 4-phosphate synthase n=1 Tax=Estrella lausannensis TaxID=483423 RepID=A0A0H5E5H3_9BACT|nr:3,4-dihydroxy-2-butanone-4-phosphate synthase [Estrella lausannensis]CRX38475.1 Riboflavin biosynthesis protein ribBA [Estrella lausannensis]
MTKSLETVEHALIALRKGKPIILVDDESRENESDFVLAAERATPETINLLASCGRGLICLALESKRVESLGLPMMAETNRSPFNTAYTISIDAKEGISTGSSVQDRARTIQVAIDPAKKGSDLITPGHVFPVKAKPGGVLERPGHTEGAVDLARLAGLNPSAVLCEILSDDGSMARGEDLKKLQARLNIPLLTIKDLIHYRLYYEKIVQPISKIPFVSQYGSFTLHTFVNSITGKRFSALIKGKVRNESLVRLHEGCMPSESFGFMGCDCASKLEFSLNSIEESGSGIFMHFHDDSQLMRHFEKKIASDHTGALSEDACRYTADAAQILKSLDIFAIRLITNDPKKCEKLSSFGIQVVERVPIPDSLNSKVSHALFGRNHPLEALSDCR